MSTDLLDLDLPAVVADPAEAKPAEANPAAAKLATQATQATPGRRGPTKKAVQQYREAVLRAVESGAPIARTLIFNARLTEEICKLDFTMYRRRLQAKHSLDVGVPELEKQAAAAEELAKQTKPWAERTFTGAQWQALQASGMLTMPPPEHQKAQQARQFVQMARQEAIQSLRETADPELARQVSELTATAQEIRGTMKSRLKILSIDQAIAKQREVVDSIIRGDDLSQVVGPVHDSRAEENGKARRRLDHLLDLAGQKPQAVADQAADQQRLTEIQAEIGKLEQARLDPRRMKWA